MRVYAGSGRDSIRASASEDVCGDADSGDQRSAANRSEQERFGRIGGDGDRKRRTRPEPNPRRLGDEEWRSCHSTNDRAALHLEERIRVDRRQLRERTLAQLGAHEHELRGERLGNRDAHSTRFGIPVHRP